MSKLFNKCFKNLETFEKVAIHNNYVNEGDGCGNEICANTEDFINENFPNAFDAINSIGRYSTTDEWAWIDDLGNLYSANSESEMELSDTEDMAEYYSKNPSYLKDIRGMSDWYDELENGLNEERYVELFEDDEEGFASDNLNAVISACVQDYEEGGYTTIDILDRETNEIVWSTDDQE